MCHLHWRSSRWSASGIFGWRGMWYLGHSRWTQSCSCQMCNFSGCLFFKWDWDFLGLSKSILIPATIVPYLGFIADSPRGTFHLIQEKKDKFFALIQKILESSYVSRPLKRYNRPRKKMFLSLERCPQQEKWIQPFQMAYVLRSQFCCVALCEKRSLISCSLKSGITQSCGAMSATFKFQWPRMHLPRDRGYYCFSNRCMRAFLIIGLQVLPTLWSQKINEQE